MIVSDGDERVNYDVAVRVTGGVSDGAVTVTGGLCDGVTVVGHPIEAVRVTSGMSDVAEGLSVVAVRW